MVNKCGFSHHFINSEKSLVLGLLVHISAPTEKNMTFTRAKPLLYTSLGISVRLLTQKSQQDIIILCACFHWDKSSRSLSGMALIRINLENKGAQKCIFIAAAPQPNPHPCNQHIEHKLKAFHFKIQWDRTTACITVIEWWVMFGIMTLEKWVYCG